MKSVALLVCLLSIGSFEAFAPPSLKAALKPVADKSSLQAATADIEIANPSTEAAEEPKQFDWFKAWHPLVPVEILDEEKPHKFVLLGQDIVVWNDGPSGSGLFAKKTKKDKKLEGNWRVFVDECPHRKVPLSEGRVEGDGSLLCSYHGWRFDSDGACVAVPQIDNKGSEMERMKQNPKSKCNSFPTKIIEGVLWVWPSSDENAILESELTPVNHREIEEGDDVWKGPWNFRELPYGQDFFVENVVDPAHVTISHHNIVGNRYDDQSMTVETEAALTKDGFTVQVVRPSGPAGTTRYAAPGLVAIENKIGEDANQALELYSAPSKPGFCWHAGRMVIRKGGSSDESAKLLRRFTLPMPTWLNHVLASSFLNQDALFLHHQERHMAKTGMYSSYEDSSGNYNDAVLPIGADKGVITYRNWMKQLAGGKIPYKNNPTMPSADNNVVFDVWNSHTKYCKYCQGALKNLKKARFAAFFVSTCLAVLRPFSAAAGNLLSTLFTAGLGLALSKLIGLFYRYEFSHAHNH